MFLNLGTFRNVPRDLGSQDPSFLHVWRKDLMSGFAKVRLSLKQFQTYSAGLQWLIQLLHSSVGSMRGLQFTIMSVLQRYTTTVCINLINDYIE